MTAADTYDGIGPWHCTECGHSHTGRQLGYICIGCACDFVPDHPTVDAFLAPERAVRP